MAVPVRSDRSGRTLEIGAATPLFRTNFVTAGATGVITIAAGSKQQYAVAPDGRFLVIVRRPTNARQGAGQSRGWPNVWFASGPGKTDL
jgi:hypothetical protein